MVEPRRDQNSGRALALGLLLALAPAARAAEELSVEATRHEGALRVLCRAVLEAPAELVWQTLTDYDRLAEFIPGMRRSRVIERHGPVALVEQSGEARFLMFKFPIEVTLASVERPPHEIEATLVKGNLQRLQGTYRIAPQRGARIALTWTGIVVPAEMPPLLGEIVMRGNIEEQFRGMVREIERREALRREREGPGK
jgi:ribosome-associated toxin RatA of RatAB toxin-antitoxin module